MSDIHEQTAALLSKLQNIATHTAALKDPRPKPPYYEIAVHKANEQVEQAVSTIQEETTQATDNLLTLEHDFNDTPIGFEMWEAVAYELALDHTNPNHIADGLGITLYQLEHLQANPYFAKMLQAKKDEVKSLGSDAAFTVKMRLIANRATSQFLQRLTSPNTNSKDFHALFKTAVELAQLVPQPDNDDAPPQAVIGASVTFNIQGVPGLEHLSTTANHTADVVEADFVEVKPNLSTNELTEL